MCLMAKKTVDPDLARKDKNLVSAHFRKLTSARGCPVKSTQAVRAARRLFAGGGSLRRTRAAVCYIRGSGVPGTDGANWRTSGRPRNLLPRYSRDVRAGREYAA